MESADLKRAVAAALAESEHAADPGNSGLMDYGDLQRVVRRLRETLQLTERIYDDLRAEYEELTERLTRSARHDPASPKRGIRPPAYSA